MTPEDLHLLARLREFEARLAAVAAAASASETLERLLDASELGAPRVALLLLRRGRFKGWNARGHPLGAVARLARLDLDGDSGWLGRLRRTLPRTADARGPGELAPDFGQATGDEAFAVVLRVEEETAGMLVCERDVGEQPWLAPMVEIAAHLARARLEREIALRRGAAPGPPAPGPPLHSTSLAPPEPPLPAPAETGLELADAAPTRRGFPAGRQEEARRFARLVATDIRLYNEEAVLVGRRGRDLATRLAEPLRRGRESFARRFPDLGTEGLRLLEEAYVEVLAGGDPALLGPGGPDSATV